MLFDFGFHTFILYFGTHIFRRDGYTVLERILSKREWTRVAVIDDGCRIRICSTRIGGGMSGLSSDEYRTFSKAIRVGRLGFPTTRWSQVRAAGESVSEADDAFANLCNDYWPPIFAYVRRLGFAEADAQDLTQGFFLHLLEYHTVRRADSGRGRFRSFLLGALKNYLANEAARAGRQKRGGTHEIVSFDDPGQIVPEPSVEAEAVRSFEESWANEVV